MSVTTTAATSSAGLWKRAFDPVSFLGVAVATLWSDLAPGHAAVISKLWPMGLLVAHLALRLRAREVDRAMAVPLLFGLVASTLGDVVIAYAFVGGIAAFLVAHLAYLTAMGRPRVRSWLHAPAALPALAIGGTMAFILVRGGRLPEPLFVPVVVYMAVISTMLARATGRALVDTRAPESRLFLAGAAMFVVSDALIALSKWVVDIPHPRAAILVTYFLAQRLLLAGVEPAGPPRD